jgi:hypothetical protein
MRSFSAAREREKAAICTISQGLVLLALVAAMALSGLAQSTPTIKLTSSVNPGIDGQPITFTATVAGTPGNPPPPVPTGTVTFFDGATALYSPVRLNATGAAAFTTSSLSAATHSITAGYSGDSNYLPVTSSVLNEVVAPAPVSDYTLTTVSPTETVTVGSNTSFPLTITPTNGYNGTITFVCVGIPTGSSCAFNPASVTPNDTESAVATSLEITTTTTPVAQRRPGRSGPRNFMLASFGGLGLLGIVFFGNRRVRPARLRFKSRRGPRLFLLGLASLALALLGSCGGSSSTSGTTTPVGTYTFTVNATGTAGTNGGNTSVHQISLTLMVVAATT